MELSFKSETGISEKLVSDLEDGSWVASPKSVEIQLIILQG
jgi:hypothetical protein